MQKQTVEFVVEEKENTVTQIGRSVILQPAVHFSGGGVKWMEDKPKAVRE